MVVLPESGWDMMARLRRRLISMRGAALSLDISDDSAVEEWRAVILLLLLGRWRVCLVGV